MHTYMYLQIDLAREAVSFDLQSMDINPNPEMVLMELIHKVIKILY